MDHLFARAVRTTSDVVAMVGDDEDNATTITKQKLTTRGYSIVICVHPEFLFDRLSYFRLDTSVWLSRILGRAYVLVL